MSDFQEQRKEGDFQTRPDGKIIPRVDHHHRGTKKGRDGSAKSSEKGIEEREKAGQDWAARQIEDAVSPQKPIKDNPEEASQKSASLNWRRDFKEAGEEGIGGLEKADLESPENKEEREVREKEEKVNRFGQNRFGK